MTPDQVTRVSPQEARRRVETGQALLVCGYEGEKFDRNHLPDALRFEEFESRKSSLPKSQPVIFYCA